MAERGPARRLLLTAAVLVAAVALLPLLATTDQVGSPSPSPAASPVVAGSGRWLAEPEAP